jgi:hypothetical protein
MTAIDKRHEERAQKLVRETIGDCQHDGFACQLSEATVREFDDRIASALAATEVEIVGKIWSAVANSHVAEPPLQVIEAFCAENGIDVPETEDAGHG